MSEKAGEAFARAMRASEKRRDMSAAMKRAKEQYEKREAQRIRAHQQMLRAAFYERHPELAA